MKACGVENRSLLWRVAEIVGRAAGDQPEEAYAAVGHVLINRIGGDWSSPAPAGRPDLRHALLEEAERELGLRSAVPGFCDREGCCHADAEQDSILCALSVVARICAGEIEDPTGGATRCHRHDNTPPWAEGRKPLALIGHWFFY